MSERRLRKVLASCFAYYDGWRTHPALDMDAPDGRAVQAVGQVVEIAEVGRLHPEPDGHESSVRVR